MKTDDRRQFELDLETGILTKEVTNTWQKITTSPGCLAMDKNCYLNTSSSFLHFL